MVHLARSVTPEVLALVRNRMLEGGADFRKLLARYDKAGSGRLRLRDLEQMVRKELKLRPTEISDEQIDSLFTHLDPACTGGVGIDELLAFVISARPPKAPGSASGRAPARPTSAPPGSARLGPSLRAAAAARRGSDGGRKAAATASWTTSSDVELEGSTAGSTCGTLQSVPRPRPRTASHAPAAEMASAGGLSARRPGTGEQRLLEKANSEWAAFVNYHADVQTKLHEEAVRRRRAKAQEWGSSLKEQAADRRYRIALEEERGRLELEKSHREADERASREDAQRAAVREAERQGFAELQRQRLAQIEQKRLEREARRGGDRPPDEEQRPSTAAPREPSADVRRAPRQRGVIADEVQDAVRSAQRQLRETFDAGFREQIADRQRREAEQKRQESEFASDFLRRAAAAQQAEIGQEAARRERAREYQRALLAQMAERSARERRDRQEAINTLDKATSLRLCEWAN